MEKRIIKIDNSLLQQSNCMLRTKLICFDGWKEPLPYNDTQYGSAFHKFVSTMYETNGDFAKAMFAAHDLFAKPCQIRHNKKHLNEHHLTKTCTDYWIHFQSKDTFKVLVTDGKPFVEVNFSEVLYEDDSTIVLGEGTIDKGGKFERGLWCIGDYKTHSLWSVSKGGKGPSTTNEINNYLSSFNVSGQLRFYTFITKLLGKKKPDSVFGELSRYPMGAFIDGVFISSSEPTQFHRSEIFQFSDEDMASYERSLYRRIHAIVALSKIPDYKDKDGMVSGACTEMKFTCKFCDYCLTRDSRAAQYVLTNNFIQKPYNPLEFGK